MHIARGTILCIGIFFYNIRTLYIYINVVAYYIDGRKKVEITTKKNRGM